MQKTNKGRLCTRGAPTAPGLRLVFPRAVLSLLGLQTQQAILQRRTSVLTAGETTLLLSASPGARESPRNASITSKPAGFTAVRTDTAVRTLHMERSARSAMRKITVALVQEPYVGNIGELRQYPGCLVVQKATPRRGTRQGRHHNPRQWCGRRGGSNPHRGKRHSYRDKSRKLHNWRCVGVDLATTIRRGKHGPLTGHDGFAQYIHRYPKLRDSPHSACDPAKIQDVLHVLEEYDMFLWERAALETEMDI
ncbi:hypothetical protein EVAR_99541_1 [Eumeta japonica]|uniref:Uncharacterized protein n=1 Tax=Eumeta variegata TaxID=151549 RepID=A0A4C1ZP93_EUMVA|nr:hypothetical protein EVAR_99541_1 [Eumeta japonica]